MINYVLMDVYLRSMQTKESRGSTSDTASAVGPYSHKENVTYYNIQLTATNSQHSIAKYLILKPSKTGLHQFSKKLQKPPQNSRRQKGHMKHGTLLRIHKNKKLQNSVVRALGDWILCIPNPRYNGVKASHSVPCNWPQYSGFDGTWIDLHINT